MPTHELDKMPGRLAAHYARLSLAARAELAKAKLVIVNCDIILGSCDFVDQLMGEGL